MRRCASKHVGSQRGVDSVVEGNKAFFIRVWKPLPSKRVSKTLRGSPKRKAQRGQYLLVVSLGYYKWYQSQTPNDMLARRLNSKGGGHEAVCQQGCWAPKGVYWGVPHWLEKGTSANKDVGPLRVVDCEIPTSVGEGNKIFLIRVWKPLLSKRILKTLRENPKEKAQRGQYLLGVLSSLILFFQCLCSFNDGHVEETCKHRIHSCF